MRRRQKEQLQRILLVMAAAIVLLLLVLIGAIVRSRSQRSNLEQDWIAARQAEEAVVVPQAPDPFANLDAPAIAEVQGTSIDGAPGETVGARVEAGALEQRVEALQRAGVERVGWRASRLGEHTVYEVDLVYRFHSVEFGPRWYVQMRPDGPASPTWGRVVPVNGLAAQLHATSMDDGLRYLNRADEVLHALTEHRFSGGTRLGSALLVFFEGREQAADRRIIGWHVVPEKTNPDTDLVYRAFFQWEEGGAIQDAWWEVNLTSRGFQAKDLQANDIMAAGGTVGREDVIDIRPRTLDLTQPPESEPNPRLRALRLILADDRLVEAVGTLLGFRGRTADLEYVGWEPNVTSERHVYDLACIFREGAHEVRVTWRVDANTGAVTPTSDIARTAHLALELADEASPVPAASTIPDGSGSGSGSAPGARSAEGTGEGSGAMAGEGSNGPAPEGSQ